MSQDSSVDVNRTLQVFIARPDLPKSVYTLLKDYKLDVWEEERVIPRDIFLKRIAGKDALYITHNDLIDAEALDAAGENLKVVATLSVGYDHLNVEELRKRGIKIGHTPGVLDDAVAELTVALLLSCSRRLFESHDAMVEGKWEKWSRWDWMNGSGVKDSVVGIIGLGRIGMEVAKRLVPFKPSRIIYTSRRPKKEAEDVNATQVPLDDLLRESDMIVVSCVLNEETRGMLNDEKFRLMKKTAFITNVSRGAVIDQEALVRALKENRIGGAALDVMMPEPLPKNHELLKLKNCITVPHIGSAEVRTRIMMAELTSKNIVAGLTGNKLPSELKPVVEV